MSTSYSFAPGGPWVASDDRFLVFHGRLLTVGLGESAYEMVAMNDLGRDAGEGDERIAWLRDNRPAFVADVERDANAAVVF